MNKAEFLEKHADVIVTVLAGVLFFLVVWVTGGLP